MTLNELKAALKSGATPTKLGWKRIGGGAYRTAYSDGKWVVKRANWSDHRKVAPSPKRQFVGNCSIPIAPFWVVGRFMIQRRYDKLPRSQRHSFDSLWPGCWSDSRYDFHYNNVGRTSTGEVVAFDW